MIDNARQIENLLYTYAERIDLGDLEGSPSCSRTDASSRDGARAAVRRA